MHRAFFTLSVIVVVSIFNVRFCAAATKSFNGSQGFAWSFPNNWTPSGLPGANDTVNFVNTDGANHTLTYDNPDSMVTFGTLTVDLTGGPGSTTNLFAMPAYSLSAQLEIIGASGSGSFVQGDVLNSGEATNSMIGADSFVLGLNATGIGTYTQAHGNFSAVGNEFIGDLGTGTFNQNTGSNTITGSGLFLVGAVGGSNGTYNLSGTSTLSTGDQYVGDLGTGTFNQTGGTNTLGNSHTLYIGFGSGAMGNYTLSSGSISTAGNEFVGDLGAGTFNQSGGTNTIAGAGVFLVGAVAGSHGTYNLSGTGTLNTGDQHIGDAGNGAFVQSGTSKNTTSGTLFVGYAAGSTGSYTLNSGTLSVAGFEYIGQSGTGTFTQNGGSNATSGDLEVGFTGSASGTYTLTAGTLSVAIATTVGESAPGAFVQTGGSHLVTQNLEVGHNAPGTYTLSGTGVLNVRAGEAVGILSTGVFNQTGGINQDIFVTGNLSSGHLTIGGAASGTYNLSGGSALIGSDMTTQENGIFNISGSGSLVVSGREYVGGISGPAAISQISGSNTINAAGGNQLNFLALGQDAGTSGSYTLSGGSMSIGGAEVVGFNGNGVFTQTGGTNTITLGIAAMGIGNNVGSIGVYNLSGGVATLNAVILGEGIDNNNNAIPGGAGALNVSETGVLNVSEIETFNPATCTVSLTGGVINTGALDFHGNPAVFTWTAGTLNLTSSVTWDPFAAGTSTSAALGPAVTIGMNQALNVTGNETIGGAGSFTLSLGPGGAHAVTGALTVNSRGTLNIDPAATISFGSFVLAGGTVNGNLTNQTSFTYQGGAFNGRLTNLGSALFQANFIATMGAENDGTMSITGNQTIAFNGDGLDNFGAITLTQLQTLAGTTVINDVGGIINSSGVISAAFVNYGTFYSTAASGLISVTGALTNYGFVGPVTAGISFRPAAGLDNLGTVQLNGGSISGSDTIVNDLGGLIQSGVGTSTGVLVSGVSAPLINSGGVIVASSNTILNLTNFGENQNGGELRIQDHASLNAQLAMNNFGTIVLQGTSAALAGGSINNFGTISGVGRVSNSIANTGAIHTAGGTLTLAGPGITNPAATITAAAGQIQIDSGSTLVISQGLATSGGSISLTGGTFDNNAVPLANSGVINGYGTLRTGGLSSTGALNVGDGDMNVFGNFTNNGTVNIQTSRALTFFNNVKGAGSYIGTGTTVFLAAFSPGNSPALAAFAGNVNLAASSTLNIELGGVVPATQYDQVHFGGQLTLGGALNVSLVNGFTPARLEKFDILDWSSRSGTFSSLALPALSSPLGWDTSNLYTSGTLSIVDLTHLPGDMNFDHQITAADLPLMELALANRAGYETLEQVGDADLAKVGDADQSGTFDNGDLQGLLYELLNGTSFTTGGAPPLGSGSSSDGNVPASVPEPSTMVLMVSAAVLAVWRCAPRLLLPNSHSC